MKRLCCMLFACFAVLSMSAYAKIDENTVLGGKTFEYAGQSIADAATSITVLKPQHTLSDFNQSEDKLSVLVGYREAKANDQGVFKVTFNFGGESGYYEAYIGIDGVSEPTHRKLHYVNSEKNASAISALKVALSENAEAVKAVINENFNDLGMGAALVDLANDSNMLNAAEILMEELTETGRWEPNVLSESLDKALAISLVNSGKISVFGDYQDALVTDEDLDNWCSKSFITNSTKQYMNGRMSKTSESFDEFDRNVIETVALGIIRDADGYGSIVSYLNEYSQKLGIDKKYITNDFAKSVIGGTFGSLDETNIKEFKPPVPNTNGNSGKSGSSGGGTGGLVYIGEQKGNADSPEPLPKDTETSSVPFADIADFKWAEEAINELYRAGIINGRAEGIFAPGESVLREEFVKMILVAGRFEKVYGSIKFSDVPEDSWFYEYIRNATACGIVNGITDTMFGSGREITRQDMAVICYNMLKSKGVISAKNVISINELSFVDKDEIADYAVSATEYLSSAGILLGDQNHMFHPQKSLTRAEATVVVYRIYSLIEETGI